ncbi:MAG: Re/Si-specific NAD(P)(+) transhydrogenase subunit alpha [Alphaproteobacteria bacterium]
MKIGIPRERRAHESRVAATPESIKKIMALGAEVVVEAGAGRGSFYSDEAYRAAGAAIVDDAATLYAQADVILKVQRPIVPGEEAGDEMALLRPGTVLIGLLAASSNRDQVKAYAAARVTAFGLEQLPRITRAQAMDVLSSQSNLAGYRAVIEAAQAFGRAFPMMMTAAGTIAPARVLVVGAGVAGLQAIATAKRLGAIVSAFDVRPAVKEQVQSLGATFVDVAPDEGESAETKGGYAREMTEDYKRRQAAAIHESIKKQDIVICTALIPGRPAPRIVTDAMVQDMRNGSVIVDLAVEQGGNCEGSRYGETVQRHGVTVIGHANMPSRIGTDASALYARNLVSFLTPLIDRQAGALTIDANDEIVKSTLLTRDGAIVHPDFATVGG